MHFGVRFDLVLRIPRGAIKLGVQSSLVDGNVEESFGEGHGAEVHRKSGDGTFERGPVGDADWGEVGSGLFAIAQPLQVRGHGARASSEMQDAGVVEDFGKCFSRNGRRTVELRIHSCESEERLALGAGREFLYYIFERSFWESLFMIETPR